MKYADYSYYLLEYKGKLQEIFFDSLIRKASREIDKNVNTRLTETKINNLPKEAQEQLKYTACALVDLISKKEESTNRKITSYSIDGVSKNFKVLSDEEYKVAKKEIINCLPDELTCFL
nr:MAG TPA: Head Tail Connector Protein [Caudoviricetes sp.]